MRRRGKPMKKLHTDAIRPVHSNGWLRSSSRKRRRMNFQFCHEQHIQNTKAFVTAVNDYGPT